MASDTLAESHHLQTRGEISESLQRAVHNPITEGSAPNNSSSTSGAKDSTELLDFFYAAENGNLKIVQDSVKAKPEIVRARHPYSGETALHKAASKGNVDIVEELVSKMEAEDLELEDNYGWTALASATRSGITRIAECLVQKNKKLVSMASGQGTNRVLPLEWVLTYGHNDMGRYLYSVTPIQELLPEKGTRGATVLNWCINAQWYDIAFELVEHCPELAIASDNGGSSTAILTLANNRESPAFPSGCRLRFWEQWIYDRIRIPTDDQAKSDISIEVQTVEESQSTRSNSGTIHSGTFQLRLASVLKIPGIKSIWEMKLWHHYSSKFLNRICQEIKNLDMRQIGKASVYRALHRAAEEGLVEIFVGIAKANSDLVLYYDYRGRNAFMAAVEYRQPKIYSLLHGISTKQVTIASVDKPLNTMLHMAGLLAPSNQLSKIPGAALQMQRELQWFKEIETITLPKHLHSKNRDGFTPRELFTKEHKELISAGEKWTKDTASSCSLVASLIATIMFAVAFTVPGGNNQDTGFPIFMEKKLFKIFIISDAISLFSSTASVLTFLGMLTSRYAENDFLKSLPTKLIIGLLSLFFSILTMTIAFCAALLILLRGESGFIITLFFLASVPVTLFGWMQFPLLIQIFSSTYGPSIFDRNVKRWL